MKVFVTLTLMFVICVIPTAQAQQPGAQAGQRGQRGAPPPDDPRDMGGGRCRHHGPQYALGHDIAALGDQPLYIGRRGPVAEPLEADDAVFFGEVDERRGNAREAHDVGLQHRQCHRRGDTRIDRVATAIEDAACRLRSEIMTAGDRIMAADHSGPPACTRLLAGRV